jgi:hypothetical protein
LPSFTRFLAVASLVALVAGPGVRARADEPAPAVEAAAPAARREVLVEIAAGDEKERDALAQVARELLGRLAIDVRATHVGRVDVAAIAAPPSAPRAGVEAPLARVWIDWASPGRATLYLLDARRDRLLVRQVERPAGGDELAREELGHILETACEGLLAGGEVGVPRAGAVSSLLPHPPPPAVVASAPSTPREDATAHVAFGASYEAAALGPQAPVTHGPAASIYVPGRRVGLWTTAQFRLPVHAASDTAGVELRTIALRALLTHEWVLAPRAALRVGVGGGVDLVDARPESTAPDRVLVDGSRRLAFGVGRAALALDVRLAARLSLVAFLAADVDVTGQRYVFSRAGGEQLVLRPWPVRPSAAVGVAFP